MVTDAQPFRISLLYGRIRCCPSQSSSAIDIGHGHPISEPLSAASPTPHIRPSVSPAAQCHSHAVFLPDLVHFHVFDLLPVLFRLLRTQFIRHDTQASLVQQDPSAPHPQPWSSSRRLQPQRPHQVRSHIPSTSDFPSNRHPLPTHITDPSNQSPAPTRRPSPSHPSSSCPARSPPTARARW